MKTREVRTRRQEQATRLMRGLCTLCGAAKATEPMHFDRKRRPVHCQDCVEGMREDADDAERERRMQCKD